MHEAGPVRNPHEPRLTRASYHLHTHQTLQDQRLLFCQAATTHTSIATAYFEECSTERQGGPSRHSVWHCQRNMPLQLLQKIKSFKLLLVPTTSCCVTCVLAFTTTVRLAAARAVADVARHNEYRCAPDIFYIKR